MLKYINSGFFFPEHSNIYGIETDIFSETLDLGKALTVITMTLELDRPKRIPHANLDRV